MIRNDRLLLPGYLKEVREKNHFLAKKVGLSLCEQGLEKDFVYWTTARKSLFPDLKAAGVGR